MALTPRWRVQRWLGRAAVCCAIAVALPSHAQPLEDAAEDTSPAWTGYWYAGATWRHLGAQDAGNLARVPLRQVDGVAIADLRTPQLQLRVRLAVDGRDAPSVMSPLAGTSHPARAELTQASWHLPLDDRTALVIARQNLGLDDGQSFHPLDFFEDIVRASDFEDRAGRARGFPMLMLERSDATGSLRLVYSDDTIIDSDYRYGDPNPNDNRGLRQWVASWRRSVGQLTFNLLARRSLPGTTGVGGSASQVLTSSWSLYGAWYAERGNSLPVHRSLLQPAAAPLGAGDVYIDRSPWTSGRRNESHLYSRWLLGTAWTAESGDTLAAELWRDDRGLTGAQRARWHRLIDFHRHLSHPAARAINVAYDLEALRRPHGTQLFLRWTRPLAQDVTGQASMLVARDGGGSLSLRLSAQPGRQHDVALEVWRRFGGAGTLNGSIPDRAGLQASMRYFF